jgi:hypothetical protein
MSDDTQIHKPEPLHVRVTRLHVHGGFNSRDIDIRDRESWKRVVRGIKETLEQGGEHHIRPLYQDDSPAVSKPNPLKPRVEELEAGIRRVLGIASGENGPGWGLVEEYLEALLPESKLAKTPAAIARTTGLENEVEDAQAKTGRTP